MSQGQAAILLTPLSPRWRIWALPCHWLCWWDFWERIPCECFCLWLLPVVWGRSPRRADSWQKMWWALEHVFERRWDVRLWEGLWSIETIYVFWKKLRPNFSTRWLFFSQSRSTHSFRFWPGSFSLVATNIMAQLSTWGRRLSNLEPVLRSLGIGGGDVGWLLWILVEVGDPLCGSRSCYPRRAWV